LLARSFGKSRKTPHISVHSTDDVDDEELENDDDVFDDQHFFDDEDFLTEKQDDQFDLEWENDLDGVPSMPSSSYKKFQEQVKQKVRIQRAKHSKRRFVDRIRIKATGGHGGNGCASFYSELFYIIQKLL
jgi:GTP-binding protein